MKFRQSGMPEEAMWINFFQPEAILKEMEVNTAVGVLLDIGCGYGTFLIPAAKVVSDKVVGIDIDGEMIDICRNKLQKLSIENVELLQWDISKEGQNKKLSYLRSFDYICLFNILHCENPINLLTNAKRMLKAGGKIGVIHWKYEDTPRGPSMDIRPTPENIIDWADSINLYKMKQVDLPPYHYGLIFKNLS